MSNLFIDTIIQHGGKLSDSEKITILDIIAKKINKKIKIIEYNYGIKLKLSKLPENNSNCIPPKIGIQTFAQIEGPYRGTIPIFTTAEIAMPSPIATVTTTGIPLTPYGPIVGVPGISINPFGNPSNTLEYRIKKAEETLTTIIKISSKLKGKKCKDITDDDSIKKYLDCVDLEDVDEKEITNDLNKIKN